MSEATEPLEPTESDGPDVFEDIPSIVFDNRTTFAAIQFNTVDQHDQAFHVFVLRQSFSFGKCDADGVATLVEPSVPAELEVEDRYFDSFANGSVAYESDLSPYKPKCDVIVNGTAYAPGNRPAREIPVRLQVHAGEEVLIDKALTVAGERWFRPNAAISRTAGAVMAVGTLGAIRPGAWNETQATAFLSLPLRYEYAVGGAARIPRSDAAAARVPKDKRLEGNGADVAHEVCEENPVGRGFSPIWYLDAAKPVAIAAPRISYPGKRFTVADFWACAKGQKMPVPAGYGIVGRAWLPRRRLAGTFTAKAHWAENEVPRLPADFDYGYWNCAPADQQCRHLRFGETFTLHNLVRHGHPSARLNATGSTVLRFILPQQAFFLIAGNKHGEVQFTNLFIDTVCIDTDAGRVDIVWRTCLSADGRFAEVRLLRATSDDQIERLDLAETAGVAKIKKASNQAED